jgi:hypothetical protein
MLNELFIVALAAFFSLLLPWSFRVLPGEKWQILASVPIAKEDSGCWRGINLTYYGLLGANAYAFAVVALFVLLGSLEIGPSMIIAGGAAVLMLCVPASRVVAGMVEKKAHTFTVGGAFFVGMVFAPFIISLLNRSVGNITGVRLPVIPALAAFSIAYAFGEGMGRLACISFGCCYGKPLAQIDPLLRRIFENLNFTFHGKTKKIAYADGLDGERVIPIQAITSVLYVSTGLAGTWLFLQSHFLAALVLDVMVTQCWRTLSETLRADFRGKGKITAYQVMGIVATVYALALPLLFPVTSMNPPDLAAGLASIWSPLPIVLVLSLWIFSFLYMGRSEVTGATLSFHVIKDRI